MYKQGSRLLPWYGTIVYEYEIENAQLQKYCFSTGGKNVRNDP